MVTKSGQFERRDLVQMESVVLQAPESELIGRRLFSVDASINPGAEAVGYDIMTRLGSAKIIANGDTALPMVANDIKRQFRPMYSIGAGAEYTVQELRAAAMAGHQAETEKVATARRTIAEFEDKLIFRGNDDYGIEGALNTEGILTMPATKTIETSTPDEILELFRKARTQLTKQTGFSNASLKLVLPQAQYEYLVGKRFSDYDARTLMQVIKDYGWFTDITTTDAMVGGGENGTDAALIFNADPSVSKILMAFDIQSLTPEVYNTHTKLGFEERTGGLLIKVPHQFIRIDNI